MEERVRRLEQEVKRLSQELSRIREFLKMPGEEKAEGPGDLAPDLQELLAAIRREGSSGTVVQLEKMRRKMGWESRRFEDAVTGLARRGAVVLHESGSLSLSRMKEGVMGDDGRMFTGVSLA